MQTFSPENETITTTTTLTINTEEGSEGRVDGERVLEALIWSCGFSKRQAFVQAGDGCWRSDDGFNCGLAVCVFEREKVHVSVVVYAGRMKGLYRCEVQHGCNFGMCLDQRPW